MKYFENASSLDCSTEIPDLSDIISSKKMIREFDRVVLTESIPSKKLKKGDVGTVVMVHTKTATSKLSGFEVEFFTLDGETLTVETLLRNQVRPVKRNEIAHVREMA